MSDDIKIMDRCFICDGSFQMGPHRYDGEYIKRYEISVCSICWKSNWDGWAPHYEERLIPHLKERGIPPPKRNGKGLLPRN
jgi:hypothetical protein